MLCQKELLIQASDLVTKVLEDRDHFIQRYFCNSLNEDGSYRTRRTVLLFTAPDGQKDKVCLRFFFTSIKYFIPGNQCNG